MPRVHTLAPPPRSFALSRHLLCYLRAPGVASAATKQRGAPLLVAGRNSAVLVHPLSPAALSLLSVRIRCLKARFRRSARRYLK